MYIDEAAFIRDEVYDAITPCLAVHGVRRILASSPMGKSGFFYRECINNDFNVYKRRTADCPRVTTEYLKQELKRMGRAQFAREYEAEFLEYADSVFPSALIRNCMSEINWDRINEGQIFLGVDFARFGEDDNVIAYCHWLDGKAYIKIENYTGKYRLTSIVSRIETICNGLKNVRRVVTDSGGLGSGPTDMLTEKLGKRMVIGVENQRRSMLVEQGRMPRYLKEDLYTNLIGMMENDKVILEDDKRIFNSLFNVRFKYTSLGILSIKGNNDHIAEAIVRAVFPLFGKKYVKPEIFFTKTSFI
jgi:hypothetical protein